MKKKEKNKGITLVALVVTIIVLIILAGISINLILGDNGIITKASQAKEKNTHATVYESLKLELQAFSIDKDTGKISKTAVEYLKEKGIITQSSINEKEYIVNVEKLCGKKLEYGNGTDEQIDVYKLIEVTTVAKLASTESVMVANTSNSENTYTLVYNGKSGAETVIIGEVYVEISVIQEEVDENPPTVTLVVEQTDNYGELKATVTATDAESGMPENPVYKYYIKYYGQEEYPTEATYEGPETTYLFTELADNENMVHSYDIKVTTTDNANNEGFEEAILVSPKVKACFVAGTKISTKDGLRNIEEIKVGDKVYTYNENTKQIEEQEILATYVHEVDEIVTLTFENEEQIKNTKEHPYYVIGKGWTETKELKVGDEILTQDNTKVKINNIETNTVENIKVYNITTAINHNYFVGITKLLVHNK